MAHQTCERLPTQTFRKELRKISQLKNNPWYETWSQLQIPKNLDQVLEKRMDFLLRYFFQLFLGISALQASKKYGIPSRTLYDKCKKMGITMGRQIQRKSLPNYPAQFPGLSGVSFKN